MDQSNSPPGRPLFLTIICVVSFLFCAWAGWQNLRSIFTDKAQRDLEKARVDLQEDLEGLEPEAAGHPIFIQLGKGTVTMLEQVAEHAVALGTVSLLYAALVAFATQLMWRRKRTGFWLFLVAQVLGFIAPFFWIRATLFSLLAFGASGFLWAVLAVLFAINLKHMR